MNHSSLFPQTRLRRLRQNAPLRNLVRETRLDVSKLVLPLFIKQGSGIKNPITSLPGHSQWSVDRLPEEIEHLTRLGIQSVMLFGIPTQKDPLGEAASADNGIIQTAIPIIKQMAPELLVMTDLCFCEYTDHGHCGVVTHPHASNAEVQVDNDATLTLLARQAVSHAHAGSDIIAPSGNMDGMVGAIRHALDAAGYSQLPILSYAVKYASAMYGPFRQAAEGAPQWGDRRTYQMDCANGREALRECALDIAEGADMLMVKPAHTYLDIIFRVKQAYPELPLCAYHTSGEYAMLKAAAAKGWMDETAAMLEVLTAIQRAGADFVITYFAKELATVLQ